METRDEHPRARELTGAAEARRLVGIDLGTTNSAVAWIDARADASHPTLRRLEVAQLDASGEVEARSTLPSFLYLPARDELDTKRLALPWEDQPTVVAGVFAREHGALVPSRQIASAKSWLANTAVDRRAALLPWSQDAAARLSPVEASTVLLRHLVDAWNHAEAQGDEALRLERQAIVLTVPASFDEEARELTVEAARAAGLEHLTLLEEPLAALYAWMAAHPGGLGDALAPHQLLLVCDVGGGTTDFTLVRAAADDSGTRFERTAVGEHLLLGGDNVDLALAALVERKLPEGTRLTMTQRQALRRQCSTAKERLLSTPDQGSVSVTVLGAGRRLVGGALTTTLTRDEVLAVLEQFLPLIGSTERPHRHTRRALRELGLPYEDDPAITRHLAAFLGRSGTAAPDVVLFNGGFFTPAVARERLLDVLASWFGARPRVLTNDAPEAAVALGAAYYAVLRHEAAGAVTAGAAERLISAGSARSYYIGVQDESGEGETRAVCILPRGTQEGTRVTLQREFTVISNQPLAFTLYSSIDRSGDLDTVITCQADDMHRYSPLVTAFRYGQRSRNVPIAVTLTVVFTEVGTLELWCESRSTGHRWRLQFDLRATELNAIGESDESTAPGVLVAEDAIVRGEQIIRDALAGTGTATADTLVAELETVFGHGKQAWPLPLIRRLADVLLGLADARSHSARLEARWLNLTGFCLRPGFGTTTDAWRIGEIRKVYVSGLAHPKDTQCQVEWLVLLQRVSAGFSAPQQQELASRMLGMLGLGTRKAPRLNPQMYRDAWRLLAGLERLAVTQRVTLGAELLPRVRREPQNSALLWSIGRFGARIPLYGPLNAVVGPDVAEGWLQVLLALRVFSTDAAAAVAQIAARTDDPARDISDASRADVIARLSEAHAADEVIRIVREHVPIDPLAGGRIFGEPLPEGLRLVKDGRASSLAR